MPRYKIQVPIEGYVYVHVKGKSAKEAGEKFEHGEYDGEDEEWEEEVHITEYCRDCWQDIEKEG